jgi:acetyl-CoA acetyltransferase
VNVTCLGATSEIVAKEFDISRQRQDEYAVESYRRAEAAQKNGWFSDEIVPVTINKDGKEMVVDRDEIRWGTTYEGISKLRPAFPEYGDRTHAGNASQVTDGKYQQERKGKPS